MPTLRADAPTPSLRADDLAPLLRADDPAPPLSIDDPDDFVHPEDPELPPGCADISPSSSSSDSRASNDDEVAVDEVEQTKKAASTQRARVRPDSPGSTLSKKESMQRLRKKCSISEDIDVRFGFHCSGSSCAFLRHTTPGTDGLNPDGYVGVGRSSRPLAPKTPATSTLLLPPYLTPDELAIRHRQSKKRARLSNGKGKGIDYGTSSKKQRVVTHPGVVTEREVLASRVTAPSASGLLRDEAYAATKSKASELSLFFNRPVGDYDKDVHFRDSELCVAKEANVVLQSRLDELTEHNLVLERDAFSVQKIKKDCDAKLAKLKLKCTKRDEEIASLKTQLSSVGDLRSSRIGEAVAAARDEMARGFAGRVS
ncbi:hypothetical protein AALP_AAs39993U000300 [Arabis alpina]|uniref:Uncharacterized protein n=1 Tax=Arabis alpina TaxID=50452 RepID=A0A087FWL0_ARAAL|nr:hypothetical protein AALP_AAs39993U000300 [Arabis alpina]